MSSVIFIFGPSCSGKSSLAQALQKDLGSEWAYIDSDVLIEQNVCSEANADSTLENKIQSIRDKVIIDAQVPWRQRKEGEMYLMVLAPLEVLLQRDAQRTTRLQRSERQAQAAREFVVETFNTLSTMDKKFFNHCFDSSRDSVIDEINRIKSLLKKNQA